MAAYNIKIDAFEGPFDLLFQLIEKNKYDINDIPISAIADQYLDYVAAMREMDLDVASEFLVMASTLLHIKSRLMLPAARAAAEEDGLDPREELVNSILEYKKYKDFSASLRERAAYWNGARFRPADAAAGYDGPSAKPENEIMQISLFDIDRRRLLAAYSGLMDAIRRSMEDVGDKVKRILERERVTIAVKAAEIMSYLSRKPRFLFQKAFNPATASRLDIVVSFITLLELSQRNILKLRQKNRFGGLLISRKTDGAA